MEYSLYVFGGGEILWKVLNGVALLFKSNSPYFTNVGILTMGIGLLYVAAQAIPKASLPIFLKSWFLPTFLLVALFYGPKSSVHIIDKVDVNFKYSKVDNIPVGIAAVASLSTHLSEYLTETIETVFTSSDSERFSKVGPMFAAKLIHAAHTLNIRDPIIKENIKDFTRQCFAWPYVFSNIAPGKQAALNTDDMLGFIEANPHPLLGIYWREGNGNSRFVNCRECAQKVREVIPIEVNAGFQSLAMKLFDGKGDSEASTNRLRQYFGDAWQVIAKGSSDAATLIQQELMLNSYRSALMDKRDELGLGRYDGDLINLNAERGQAQQDTSFLVKAALSGSNVPTIHTIIFALALMYFALIAPMTFLPGGIKMMVTWVKVMIWLATWPVLFTILNCLGHMFAAGAMSTQMIGYGEGLTLMTQNGLADSAFTAYAWVMGLQYSIPFLSWALISGGGYAFSQLSSSFTQSGESFAAKTGAELVDGNVSFDSQTLHHRSVANSQIAQQQLGAAFNYGQRYDDGKIASIYGTSGQVTFQEHQTQLGTNVSQNDTVSAIKALQSGLMEQSGLQQSISAGAQYNQGINNLFSAAKSFADNTGWTETFGDNEAVNAQKSLQDSMSQIKQYAADNKISEEKALALHVKAGLGASIGTKGEGFLGKLSGLFDLGVGGEGRTSASDNEAVSKLAQSGQAKQFMEQFSQGLTYIEDHKGSLGQSYQVQQLEQAQHNFSQAKVFSDQASASFNKSKSINESMTQQRQKGVSSGSNLNDAALQQIAESKFGGNVSAAAAWQAENPNLYAKEVEGFLSNRHPGQQVQHTITRGNIKQDFEGNAKSLDKAPSSNQAISEMREKSNLEADSKSLNEKLSDKRSANAQQMQTNTNQIKSNGIESSLTQEQQNFEKEKDRSLTKKALTKIGK